MLEVIYRFVLTTELQGRNLVRAAGLSRRIIPTTTQSAHTCSLSLSLSVRTCFLVTVSLKQAPNMHTSSSSHTNLNQKIAQKKQNKEQKIPVNSHTHKDENS